MSRGKLLGTLAATALWMLAVAGPAQADFTVNDLSDFADFDAGTDATCDAFEDGPPEECTLRAAIQTANFVPGLDTITFSVSGTITPVSTLTNATEQVTIDGNGSGTSGSHTIIDGNDLFRLMFFNHGAGTVTLKNLRLTDGHDGGGGDGGGAVRTDGDLTLTNVVATSNGVSGVGAGSGGAIFNTSNTATLNVTDSVISNNTISSTGANVGGGIQSAGPLNLTNSVVSGNSITAGTSAQGGGISASSAYDIDSSTVSGNSVVATAGMDQGGGFFGGANAGTKSIVNSTITGNTGTSDGGAGAHLADNTAITNVTFANNSDGGASPGDDLEQNAGTATVQNTIFASDDPCEETGTGNINPAVNGHNIDEGTTCLLGATNGNMNNTDPLITGATLFGGGQLIHIPLFNSPAIDNADISCGGGLLLDQRGLTRPQGGAGNCDIGAYERDYRTLNVSKTGTGTGTVTSTTGINCGGTCSESHVDGTPGLVLTATPASGSQVGTWSGCDSSTATTCTVDLGNDRLVSVSFEPVPSTGGGGGGTTTTTPPAKKCKKGQKLKKGKCVKKKKKRKK